MSLWITILLAATIFFETVSSSCISRSIRFIYKTSRNGDFCGTVQREEGYSEYYCNGTAIQNIRNYNYNYAQSIVLINAPYNILSQSVTNSNHLRKLEIHQSPVTKILPSFLSGMSNLIYLDLAENKIETLVEGFLYSSNVLQILNISHNEIKKVESHTFSGTNKLLTLDLSFNKIEFISESAFNEMKCLNILILKNNIISKIDIVVASLRILYLSHNNLTEFSNNVNLDTVDLSYNNIQNIESIKIINTLNVSHNQLTNMNNISNVQNLNISYNLLEHMTDINYEILNSLDISNNYINKLDPDIFENATKLYYLDISYNAIKDMPSDIFRNTPLQYLNIASNRFSRNELEDNNNWINILSIPTLKTVSLANNSWICSDLQDIINLVFITGAKIVNGNKRNGKNILGNACINAPVAQISNSSTQEYLNAQISNRISEQIHELQENMLKLAKATKLELEETKHEILKNITHTGVLQELVESALKNISGLNNVTKSISEKEINERIDSYFTNKILPKFTEHDKVLANLQKKLETIIKNQTKNNDKQSSYLNYSNLRNDMVTLNKKLEVMEISKKDKLNCAGDKENNITACIINIVKEMLVTNQLVVPEKHTLQSIEKNNNNGIHFLSILGHITQYTILTVILGILIYFLYNMKHKRATLITREENMLI